MNTSKQTGTLGFWPLCIAGAAFLWSLDAFFRTELYALPPVLVSFWEHLIGLVVIAPFFVKYMADLRLLGRREWLALLYIGLLAGPVGLILYMTALTQTSFANFSIVVLLQQTQPIWAILFAAVLLKERITTRFLVFAAVAMAGVYLIVFPDLKPNFDTGEATLLAGVLALLAAGCWGTATAVGKYALQSVHVATVTFVRFVLAAAFSLLVFVGFALLQQSIGTEAVLGTSYVLGDIASLSAAQWQSVMMIVLITGAGAMLLYYFGLKRVPARVATIFELTWPASSLVIGIVAFDNTFTVTQIIGIVSLVISMVVIARTQRV